MQSGRPGIVKDAIGKTLLHGALWKFFCPSRYLCGSVGLYLQRAVLLVSTLDVSDFKLGHPVSPERDYSQWCNEVAGTNKRGLYYNNLIIFISVDKLLHKLASRELTKSTLNLTLFLL